MKNRPAFISGLIGAAVFGLFAILVISNHSLNRIFGRPLDIVARPVQFIFLTIGSGAKDVDSLFGAFLILCIIYYMGIGFLLFRYSILIIQRLRKARTRRTQVNRK